GERGCLFIQEKARSCARNRLCTFVQSQKYKNRRSLRSREGARSAPAPAPLLRSAPLHSERLRCLRSAYSLPYLAPTTGTAARRNPMKWLRMTGPCSSREADRQLLPLKYQHPPRSTRAEAGFRFSGSSPFASFVS